MEVAEQDGGLGAGDDQDDEDEEQEAEHVVHLVGPAPWGQTQCEELVLGVKRELCCVQAFILTRWS